MRVVMFYHSLISDWNHGNAHFLRGIATELLARGHSVSIFEPIDSWSVRNLALDHGTQAVNDYKAFYPNLSSVQYSFESLDLDEALGNADLVLVHEWNTKEVVKRLGEHRAKNRYQLLFHDTHHRMVTDSQEMAHYDLKHYDGVLAFGKTIADLYLSSCIVQRAWTWHEAADTRVFSPSPNFEKEGDIVWIGNWGDEERTWELQEFFINPVRDLKVNARVYGVRYPERALTLLQDSGIQYSGWISNFKVPQVFSRFRATVHIPRRPYVETLPGIPTIRVFEALACGIPLICSPWNDSENLFTPGSDFLVANNPTEMKRMLRQVLEDRDLAQALVVHGMKTILSRHTCAHRADELLSIYSELGEQSK